MVPEKIISQIETWITNVLDTPNSKFGNLPPCPYAKQAWVEGNVSVKIFDDIQSMIIQSIICVLLHNLSFNDSS